MPIVKVKLKSCSLKTLASYNSICSKGEFSSNNCQNIFKLSHLFNKAAENDKANTSLKIWPENPGNVFHLESDSANTFDSDTEFVFAGMKSDSYSFAHLPHLPS